jgi:hypothetical protein
MPSRKRNRRIVPSPEPEDQPSAPAPPPAPAPLPADRETFNLDIVSGDEDGIHVNDPDKAASARIKSTADIEYFFDKTTEAKTFCKECR